MSSKPLSRLDRILLKGLYTNDRGQLENPTLFKLKNTADAPDFEIVQNTPIGEKPELLGEIAPIDEKPVLLGDNEKPAAVPDNPQSESATDRNLCEVGDLPDDNE